MADADGDEMEEEDLEEAMDCVESVCAQHLSDKELSPEGAAVNISLKFCVGRVGTGLLYFTFLTYFTSLLSQSGGYI